MTLFDSKPDTLDGKTPQPRPRPRGRNKYTPGFIKAYENYGKKVGKAEAFAEWIAQQLEPEAEQIAQKALAFHTYCLVKDRMQMDFRRWLHNQGWEDELLEGGLTYRTPEEAYKAFKDGKWTHCNDIDCRELRVQRNSDVLILGDKRIFRKEDVRNLSFCLKFDGKLRMAK